MLLVAEYLNARGYDVCICDFNERESIRKIADGIKVYNMTHIDAPQKFAWIGKRIKQYKQLNKLVKEIHPDVICSFLNIPNMLAVLVGKRNKVPTVISERADPYQSISKIDKLMHCIYNRADGAVFQTMGAQEFYGNELQKKSIVIPNPIVEFSDKKWDIDNTDKAIAFVARFENAQKRQDVMLQAFRIVLKKQSDYELRFYGDGPDLDRIKKMAYELKINSNVCFCGVKKNINDELLKCRLFVLTSDYEGIPNSLLEAMSLGVPCISTDYSPGGARMLIENGVSGMLCDCGDYESIAKAIETLIDNDNLAITIGHKAMYVNEIFSYDKLMNDWERYLTKIQTGDI
jgi:glycosyltransferase involved in cell wall biosynthesis